MDLQLIIAAYRGNSNDAIQETRNFLATLLLRLDWRCPC